MGKIIATMIVGLLLAWPFATAQNAQGNAEAGAVSAMDLRVKELKEDISDFVFNIKSALTFSEEGKVELLKERNQQLKSRQESWLELKSRVQEQFKSGNVSAEEKQGLASKFQSKHKELIEEHLEITSKLGDIRANAQAKNNTELKGKAKAAARAAQQSKISAGLGTPGSAEFGLSVAAQARAKGKSSEEDSESNNSLRIQSEADARARAEQQFGLELQNATVETETRNGKTVYVVTGTKIKETGKVKVKKDFTVEFSGDMGAVLSADLNTSVVTPEMRTAANADVEVGLADEAGNESEENRREDAEAGESASSEGEAENESESDESDDSDSDGESGANANASAEASITVNS